MKLPKAFIPDMNLDEKFERIIKPKARSMLTSLIYEGLKIIKSTDDTTVHEDFFYPASFEFNDGTKVFINYMTQPFFERVKGLMCITGSDLGLDCIKISSVIKNPVEAIEKTFSENPLKYKSLPFQETKFTLDKLIEKDSKLVKDAKQFRNSLIIDRIACNYLEEENCYKLTSGNFYSIIKAKDIRRHENYREKIFGIKEKTFHTMSIYDILPFTEREKELLSNMEEFEISYRFPRPNEDADRESKHLFQFRIKKMNNKYSIDIDISDGFASGLDLKSIWPAERLFDYLNSERKMVCLDERVSMYDPRTDRYNSSGDKKLYEKSLDPLSLYKEDAEGFITYFSSRDIEEKKKLIESMMNCDFTNEKVVTWLDKNETKLVREVGFN